jgi:hypothetical protein
MKKVVLFLGFAVLPLCAGEVEEKPTDTLAMAAQVASVGLFGYGAWQAVQTWNNPESVQLYTNLVNAYTSYLDTYEPSISAFNRFGRIAHFKYVETMRQLTVPLTLAIIGAEIFIIIALNKLSKQAQAEAAKISIDMSDSDEEDCCDGSCDEDEEDYE